MTNEEIRNILERRTSYEARIRELGGKIPQPWPWDFNGTLRNVQLIERIEELESGGKLKPHTPY